MVSAEPTPRLSASPWTLLRQAAGTPRDLLNKTSDLARGIASYANSAELDARLQRLRALGHIERIPNRVQLIVGAIDMLRFWISPAAADYYSGKGISYSFHQLLRILDDPRSMIDPTGFLSERDTIIGHLMQVVHANPCYDLQLLEAHADGLDELQRQLHAMIDGSHPRAASIGAIVEEPDYHQRLLDYTVAYRHSRDADAPIRDNVTASGDLQLIERTFGTLPRAMAYFANLPSSAWPAAQHLLTVQRFPVELAPP